MRAMALFHLDEIEFAADDFAEATRLVASSRVLATEELESSRLEDWLLVQMLLRESQELLQ